MTSLIIPISIGKGTWTEAARVINSEPWEKVFIITNNFGSEKFTTAKEAEYILIDPDRPMRELSEHLVKHLSGKIKDLEVAVNLVSGTGSEHMAIISAILKLGLAMRLVSEKDGRMEEL